MNCLYYERNTRQPYNGKLCLFRALALHLHGNEKLEEETSKFFNIFLENSEEEDNSKHQGAHLIDIPKVEDLLQLNIFLHDTDFEVGELIVELCRRSSQIYGESVKLLRFNNHIWYVSNISAVLKTFRCTTCGTFFSTMGNPERYLVTCSNRVEHVCPKKDYELGQILFEKLDAFIIPYRNEQKLSKNLAIFDFETIRFKERSFKQTETTTRIGKHVPISVSMSSNLIPELIFLQRQSSSSHIVFYHCTRRIGDSKQSSDEIEFY